VQLTLYNPHKIKNAEVLQEFNDRLMAQKPADYFTSLEIFEALWAHATQLGVLPPKDPLDGLEVDLRLAEALNVR
jgi:hypothetical protein